MTFTASMHMRRLALGCGCYLFLSTTLASSSVPAPAIAYGEGNCGKLRGGVALPCRGSNFEAFSSVGCAAGRNYVHPLVSDTVVEAYAALAGTLSQRRWQYGDLGWREGGELKPHKTHQNGLSADFYVPVSDAKNQSLLVPISILNKYRTGLEFDSQGRLDELHIDWNAIAEHVLALEAAGRKRGVRIERIIFCPEFQILLLQAQPRMARFVPLFNKRGAGVRHDEHYHIDFAIPAKLHKPLKCR